MNRAALKQLSKEQIKGNIGILFVCMLIIGAITSLASAIDNAIGTMGIITLLVAIFVTPILGYGINLNHINMSRQIKASIPTLFDGFKDYGRVWLTFFLTGLFEFLWSLLFVIPGIVKAIAYSFAPYIIAENPGISARDAIKRSKEITQGHKGELFVLYLSFIWWILLTSITCGIAGIYVFPYMNQTYVNAYHSLANANTAA